MSEWSKRLLLVACVSLVSGTAAAAIPDEAGVFHACLNVLSGSIKLVDGTTCGLLERHVAWNQQGVRGPQGPVGPQGAQGPAGERARVVVDTASLTINGFAPAYTDSPIVFSDKSFTAEADGTCILTVRGKIYLMGEDDAIDTPITLSPAWLQSDWSTGANLLDETWFVGQELPSLSFMTSVTTVAFNVRAGVTYRWGARVRNLGPDLADDTAAQIGIMSQCSYK